MLWTLCKNPKEGFKLEIKWKIFVKETEIRKETTGYERCHTIKEEIEG